MFLVGLAWTATAVRNCYWKVRHGEGRELMAHGKIQPIARKCRNCGTVNEAGQRGIKSGYCYGCRKLRHESKKIIVSKTHKIRLVVLLSVISLVFLTLAGYSIYFKCIVLPYGSRGRSSFLEFKGFEVAVPALSLILLSVGTLSTIAVNNSSNGKVYEK
ncbi:hypothetical protein [Pseudomonas sp. NFX224]|uniref:hypothetical protein n=1 Tax=Pseudomonas sp. NFX224 TaxID=3402862 RepID=UPI003AFB729D